VTASPVGAAHDACSQRRTAGGRERIVKPSEGAIADPHKLVSHVLVYLNLSGIREAIAPPGVFDDPSWSCRNRTVFVLVPCCGR
jgi:hypothetical protein